MSVKRLTKYICDRAHGAQGVSESKLTGAYCRGQFEATAVVERLAVIEDILGDTYDLDRLRELVEADKDGRCVVPPCKNGDAVWYITPQGELCEARVIGIWLNIYTNPQLWMEITYFSNLTGQCDFKSRIDLIFGKTVFLTKEAAKAAMGKEEE